MSDDNWLKRAACRQAVDPELFFDKDLQKQAVHLCRVHCPVRHYCHETFRRRLNVQVVVGGVAYGSRGEVLDRPGGVVPVTAHNAYCRALPREGEEG